MDHVGKFCFRFQNRLCNGQLAFGPDVSGQLA